MVSVTLKLELLKWVKNVNSLACFNYSPYLCIKQTTSTNMNNKDKLIFLYKQFVGGTTSVTRQDIQEIGINPKTLTDDIMRVIAGLTERYVRLQLKLNRERRINLNDEAHNKAWWSTLKKGVNFFL